MMNESFAVSGKQLALQLLSLEGSFLVDQHFTPANYTFFNPKQWIVLFAGCSLAPLPWQPVL